MSHDFRVFVLGVGVGIIAICAAELIGMFAAQCSRQRELQSALDRVKSDIFHTLRNGVDSGSDS